MGLYAEHVLPRIVDTACGLAAYDRLRRRVCGDLAGDVAEIGFGSGLNVPFYPAAVTRVAAVEPADLGWRLAGARLRATSIPVQRAGLDAGAALPFVEHGRAPDARVRTWQRRLEPVQKTLFGGCHLTRPIADLITSAGFEITELDVFYEERARKVLAAFSLGTARSV